MRRSDSALPCPCARVLLNQSEDYLTTLAMADCTGWCGEYNDKTVHGAVNMLHTCAM